MSIAAKDIASSLVLILAFMTGQGMAHDGHAVPVPEAAKSGVQIQDAGIAFWTSLPPAKQALLSYPFEGREAAAYWASSKKDTRPEIGLSLSELSIAQRGHLNDLLIASTSTQGFFKIKAAMQASTRADDYKIAIFGNPRMDRYWSYSLNGPHLRYNVMVLDGHMMLMPVFYGVSSEGPTGIALPQEFARGYELLSSLMPDQRIAAIVSAAWDGAHAVSINQQAIASPPTQFPHRGISGDQLRPGQRSLLWKLIVEYVANSDFDFAADHFQKINASGWQSLHFMWMGPTDGNGPVFYRVSGPSILMDFAQLGNDEGEDIHPHVLIRDPNSAHGANWLSEHFRKHH